MRRTDKFGSHTKKPTFLAMARQSLGVLVTGSFLFQQTLQAAAPPLPMPTGGAYTAGAGSIKTSGNAVTINQSTLRGIIDWNTFSVGQGGTVTFQNGSGATLNRVNGSQMSSILGSLLASGSVYLINPQGVLIGPGARVHTGGDFVASTLKVSPDAFLKGGALLFGGESKNVVVNLGDIFSKDGSVFLLGHEVKNAGRIQAANGTAGLASGSEILLKDSTGDERVFVQAPGGDLTNTGTVAAAQAELKAKGGNIYALAGNNGGTIAATGTATINGRTWLIADGGKTQVTGTVSAQNANGRGGNIETSGHDLDISHAAVKTGQGGNWLLDPVNVLIDSAAAATIQNSLATTDVTVQTTATTASGPGTQSPGNGDITVASNLNWSSGSSLYLEAYRNINVNSGVTVSSGIGNLNLYADNGAAGSGTVNLSGNVSGNVNIVYRAPSYTSPTTFSNAIGIVKTYMTVDSPSDLNAIRNNMSGSYAINKDIDMGSFGNFTPIGSNATSGFNGTVNGMGHQIKNLTINTVGGGATPTETGLFGLAGANASLFSFGVSNAAVAGYDNTGILIGDNHGTVASVFVTGTVSGRRGVGGLIGINNNNTVEGGATGLGHISDSYSTASVSGSWYAIGGLVGFNNSSVARSFAAGSVSGPGCSYGTCFSGGFIGYNYGSVSNSYNVSTATGFSNAVGSGSGAGVSSVTMATMQNGTLPAGYASPAWKAAPGYYPRLAFEAPFPLTASGIVYNNGSLLSGVTVNELINGTVAGTTTTSASGAYSFTVPSGTTGVLTYLASGGYTGNTFKDGTGTTSFSGMDIYVGSLRLLANANTTYSGMIAALNAALGSNTGSNFLFSSTPTTLTTNLGTNLEINSAGPLTVDQSVGTNRGKLLIKASGNLTLGAVTLEGDSPTRPLTIVTGGTLVSNAGTQLIAHDTVEDNTGNWSAYSTNPANDILAGDLASYDFKQYNATYPATTPAGSGNGLLYSVPGTLTVGLTSVSKTYDQSSSVSLTPNNFTTTGKITGDTVAITTPSSGTFANANAGTGKAVTAPGLSLGSATDSNGKPVYGYSLSSTIASGTGTISPYQLTETFTANNKTYDGTTGATATLGSLSSPLSEDTVSVTGTAAYNFTDKNAGTGKTVTASGLTLTGAQASNYSLVVSQNGTADITARTITGTVTGANKVYDGTATATASTALSSVVSGDNVAFTGATYSFADKNVGTGKTISETGGTLTGSDVGNYALGSVTSGAANITPLALTTTLAANDKTYDGTITATGTLGSPAGVVSGDVVSIAGTPALQFADKNAGTGKTVTASGLTLTGADAGNYTVSAQGSATITPLTINGSVVASSKVYDGTTLGYGSISLSGLISGDAVGASGTYAFADKNVGSAKAVTASGVTLAGSSAANYSIGSVTAGTANIVPRTLLEDFSAGNKVYDGATLTSGTLGSLYGLVSGDSISLSGTPVFNFVNKNVGNYKPVNVSGVTLTGPDAGNYNFGFSSEVGGNITPAALTQAFVANNKVYDGTTTATGALGQMLGAVAGDNVAVSGTASFSFANKNAGTAKLVSTSGLSLTGADASNYTFTAPTGTANITPAQVTQLFTVNNKVYDATVAATGTLGTVSGVISGDTVALQGSASFSFANKNAGTAKLVSASGLSLAGADASNYTLAMTPTATANIAPAPLTQTFTANNKVYDATTNATGALGNLSGVFGGDSVAVNGTAVYQFPDKNAGTGKSVNASGVSLTGADANNYNLSVVQSGTAGITPAPLTQSFTANNKVYDATTTATAALGRLSGVIGGDTVAVNGTAAYRFADKNAGTAKTVTGAGLILTGTDANNYTLAMTPTGTAAITPAKLTASFTANNKVYDGGTTATAAVGSLSGILAGDAVTLDGTPVFNFSDKNAGAGKSVTATAMLAGADAKNYTVNLVQNGVADVTPAQLLYTASSGAVRPYGVSNPALSGTVTGLVGGDTLASAATGSPVFTTSATVESSAGAYSIMGSGLTLTSGNYTLAQAPGNANAFTINPITIRIGNASKLAGSPNPTFTVSYSGLSSDYLQTLLSGLKLVTNAPASDTPGTYQILALVPSALANSILVQPGTLMVAANNNVLINNGTPQAVATIPAALNTQTPAPPMPLPSVNGSFSMADQLLPGNVVSHFQVVIQPSSATGFQSSTTTADALSQASFTETSPDGRTKDNKSTYAAGAKK